MSNPDREAVLIIDAWLLYVDWLAYMRDLRERRKYERRNRKAAA